MGTYLGSPKGAKVNEKIKELYNVIKTYLQDAKAAGLRRYIKQFVNAIRPYQVPGTNEELNRLLNQANTVLKINPNELLEWGQCDVLLNFFVGSGSPTLQITSTPPRSRTTPAADQPESKQKKNSGKRLAVMDPVRLAGAITLTILALKMA